MNITHKCGSWSILIDSFQPVRSLNQRGLRLSALFETYNEQALLNNKENFQFIGLSKNE